jgi:hypothetical protein
MDMLHSITWGQYFSTIIGVIVIYYIAVGFRYFKWEILNVIGIKKIWGSSLIKKSTPDLNAGNYPEDKSAPVPNSTSEIDVTFLIQSFTDEIKAFVQCTDNSDIEKAEIINSITTISSKYTALRESNFKNELEVFVFNEINQQYPKMIEIKDFNKIWY